MEKMLSKNNTETMDEVLKSIRASFPDIVRDEFVQKKTFSPSAIVYSDGRCARRWHLLFNGAQWQSSNTSQEMDRMQAGTDGHNRIQSKMELAEIDTIMEYNLRATDPPVNSYVDVVVKPKSGDKVIPVEIKTVSDMAFEARKASWKPAPYHLTQLLIYMRLLGSDEGVLFYENRDTFKKLTIPVYMTEDKAEYVDYVLDWMREVYKAYEDDQLAEVFKGRRVNSRLCAGCPVRKACDEAPIGDVQIPLLKEWDKK